MTSYFRPMKYISFAALILSSAAPIWAAETLVRYKEVTKVSDKESDYVNTYVPAYKCDGPEIPTEGLQCPIPHEDRVKNYTGIQCVYSSIEALGRWAEEPKLVNPPLTSRPECKGYSGPRQAAAVLDKLKVRYEQTYGNKEKGLKLIKKAMREGRGVLWDVPGHAMILLHYDEVQDKVCWVDNSDSTLKVQQTTVEKFNKRWGSWVLAICPDKDFVPEKARGYGFPIHTHSGEIREFPRGYLPFPDIMWSLRGN